MSSSSADREALVIAAAQPRCTAYDIAQNAAAHAEAVHQAEARVVVFPELSITGYQLDTPVVDPGDTRLGSIVTACAAANSVALVGAPVAGTAGDHIAMLRIDAAGVSVVYHKMWLGDAEAERFSAGTAPTVVEVDGWRLGLAICKDTGVSRHAADTAALGMDIYVAGVLDSAEEIPIQEERARRITVAHGVWMAVASFAGSTGGGYQIAAGHSRIWSPDGEIVASAGGQPGEIVRVSIETFDAAHSSPAQTQAESTNR